MAQNSPTNFLATANDLADYDFQWSPAFRQAFSFILNEEESPLRLESIDLQPVTKVIQKPMTSKRSYINVSNELRSKLIEAVHKNGEKVKYAAKRLGINYSSAKVICQIYKKEGRSERRSTRRRDCFESTNKKFHEQVMIPSTVFSVGSAQVSYFGQLSLNEGQNPLPRPSEFKKCLFHYSSSKLMKESPFSDKSPFHNSELGLSANLILSTENERTVKNFRNESKNATMGSVLEQNLIATALPIPQNIPYQNPNTLGSQIIPLTVINPQIQPHHPDRKDSCIQQIPIVLQNAQHQQMKTYNMQNGNIVSNGFPGGDKMFYMIFPQANYIAY